MSTRSTLVRLTLRFHRAGFVAISITGVFFGLMQALAYPTVAGTSPEERLRFARQMEPLAAQMSYLLPNPQQIDTLPGFVWWRGYGTLAIIFGFWALVAGAGATRGDEERGLVDQWLSTGVSRVRYLTVRAVGFAVVAAMASGLTVAGTGVGASVAGEPIGLMPLLGQGVALALLSVVAFTLTLLIAQFFATRRSAAGAAGAALLVLFFANSLSRTNSALDPFRWLSPFWYYDRSDALVPGGALDPLGVIVSSIAAVALTVLASVAFVRRDIGEPLFRLRTRARAALRVSSRNPLLRVPVLPSLYEQRVGLLFWLIGVSLLAAMFASLARSMVDLMANTPTMRAYLAALSQGGTDLAQSFIGLALFGVLQLLLALYAVTHVARWAADDAEGRLELILAQPVHRWWVVVERGLALAIGAAAIAGMGALVAGLSANAWEIRLDATALRNAALLLVPLTLAFGAIGAALMGFAPRIAVPLLATVALATYFVQLFGLLFGWPEWIMNLSLFELYGAPLATGIYWLGLWALLGIVVAGFAIGIVSMQRREVGR